MKLAIATTFISASSYLHTFIEYHLAIGFDNIFLFSDDPEDREILKYSKREDVIVFKNNLELQERWKRNKQYSKCKDFINSECQARQIMNVNVAIEECLTLGVDWLLHIDIDELFYSPLQHPRSHFSDLTKQGLDFIVYNNHEAIPESMEIGNMFKEVKLFKKNQATLSEVQRNTIKRHIGSEAKYFKFYDSGKAAVRVRSSAFPISCHRFTFEQNVFKKIRKYFFKPKADLVYSHPCVLHYACCGFENFRVKYEVLGAFGDLWFKKDPIKEILPFHIHSRDVFTSRDIKIAEEFYIKHFLNTPLLVNKELFLTDNICFEVDISQKLLSMNKPVDTN